MQLHLGCPFCCFYAKLNRKGADQFSLSLKCQYSITNTPIWAHLSLLLSFNLCHLCRTRVWMLVQNNRCHRSWPSSSEKRGRLSLISFVVVSFFFFFFFTFIKCLLKYLTQVCSFQMRRWLILEVKPFRLKEIVFDSLCFQNLISQLRNEWLFSGFSTWFPSIFQLFLVST